MGTSGVGSASGSWLGLSGPTFRASHGASAMGWSLAVPGALFLWPITCTKMAFISKFMTFLAPCWAFSQWMRCTAFVACLAWATLGSVAIAFHKLECLDLIYGCCCCNSTIGFLWLKPFIVILCSLAQYVAWYVTSSLFFFNLTHFLTSKCFVTWKSNSVLHTFFSTSVGTGIFLPDLWYIDLTGQ